MKKNAKKNVCKENQYNVKIIRMNPATAMEQLLDVMVNLDTEVQENTKYAMDFTNFTDDELLAFDRMMFQIIELRSRLHGKAYKVDMLPIPVLAR
jgi:hypothetical protein